MVSIRYWMTLVATGCCPDTQDTCKHRLQFICNPIDGWNSPICAQRPSTMTTIDTLKGLIREWIKSADEPTYFALERVPSFRFDRLPKMKRGPLRYQKKNNFKKESSSSSFYSVKWCQWSKRGLPKHPESAASICGPPTLRPCLCVRRWNRPAISSFYQWLLVLSPVRLNWHCLYWRRRSLPVAISAPVPSSKSSRSFRPGSRLGSMSRSLSAAIDYTLITKTSQESWRIS